MGVWNGHFPIKDLFPEDDVEDEVAQQIGKTVATRLREQPEFFGEIWTERFAKGFEQAQNQDEFNEVLNDLYDMADAACIWID